MKRFLCGVLTFLMLVTMVVSALADRSPHRDYNRYGNNHDYRNPNENSPLMLTFQFAPRSEATMAPGKMVGKAQKLGTVYMGHEYDSEYIELQDGNFLRKAFLSQTFMPITLPEGAILYNQYNVTPNRWASIASTDVGGKTAYITEQWGDIARVVIPNCGDGTRNWVGYINLEEYRHQYMTNFFYGNGDSENAITITKTHVTDCPWYMAEEVAVLEIGTEVKISTTTRDGWAIILNDDGTQMGYTMVGCLSKYYRWEDLGSRWLFLLTEPGRESLAKWGTGVTWQYKEKTLWFKEYRDGPDKVVFPGSEKNKAFSEDGRMGFPVWER